MNTASSSPSPAADPRSSEDHARRMVRAGAGVIAVALLPIGAWMCLAPLSMAVVAPGYVKVDLNRRPVQHLEGGIVHAVLVRDGQHVKAGEPVLMLRDVGVDADRNRLAYRVDVERAAICRLQAEQSLAAQPAFPADLLAAAGRDPRVAEALHKERVLFQARRSSMTSEITLLQAQHVHIEREMDALRAQLAHARQSLALQQRELEANRDLLKDGFISPMRIAQIEATVLDYAAKLEERNSELARASQRLVDNDLRIRSIQNEYRQTASDQLKETAARLAEIEQEQRKSEDAAQRQVVTAPTSGEVLDLKFTSPGAVVRPGEPIADIVPSDARLLVEAQIRPEDISNVRLGQPARVKFTAFKYRSLSMVEGRVAYVAADRLLDRSTGMPYYSVLIEADPDALRATGELKVQAGMTAEVYIEGTRQTALQYLTDPVTSTIRKAGRQM